MADHPKKTDYFAIPRLALRKLEAFTQRIQYEEELAARETRLYQDARNYLGARPGFDPDDTQDPDEMDLETIVEDSRVAYWRNPYIRGAVDRFVDYAVGNGFTLDLESESEPAREYLERLERGTPTSALGQQFHREVILRALIDGEAFVRKFPRGASGLPEYRFVDPLRVTDPTGTISHGIETVPGDIQTPRYYYIVQSSVTMQAERVPASEIWHFKLAKFSDVKRGRPWTEPALPEAKMFAQWKKDRYILNKVRSSIAMIQKVKGGATRVTAISQQGMVSQSASGTGSNAANKSPRPGTVLTTNDGVDIQMRPLNIGAGDTVEDGRTFGLAIAVALGVPEFLVLGDASNSNYSSTLIAEGPFVKQIHAFQAAYGADLGRKFIPALMMEGVRGGVVAQGEPLWAEVHGDQVEARDKKVDTEVAILQIDAGLSSRETAQGKLGFDHELEAERMAAEFQAHPDNRIRDDAGMDDDEDEDA